jgi:type III pantothenate kinase
LLLAVDVGNSHIKLGLFEGSELLSETRIPTDSEQAQHGLNQSISQALFGIGTDLSAIKDVAICSVIPRVTTALSTASRDLFGILPFVINYQADFGMEIHYYPSSDVGPDRLVNTAIAKAIHGSPAIVIAMGTATTFDVLDHKGDFAGGAIAPGLGTASRALFTRAPRLKQIDYKKPERAIGTTSQECLQSGILLGYAAMVDGMISRIRREMVGEPKIIATGGWAEQVAQSTETIETVDPSLTLKGIQFIRQRNG